MKTFAAVLTLALLAAPAGAAEDASAKMASMSAWFKNLKNALVPSMVSGRYTARSVTSVAAVRGDEQTALDPDRPEWRTSTKSPKLEARKEKAALASAVDLIMSGKYDDGKSAIAAFEKDYPKSPLLTAAREARQNADLLAQLRGVGSAPETASTSPAEGRAPAAKTEDKAPEKSAEKPAEPKKAE